MNYRMHEKVDSGEAIDLSSKLKTAEGDYILSEEDFVEGMDYCDLSKEQWIWSIGRNLKDDYVYASTSTKYYDNPDYECLWLR